MDSERTARQGDATQAQPAVGRNGNAVAQSVLDGSTANGWDDANGRDEKLIVIEQLAILFVDIRGFTGFAASRSPAEVVELLTAFFGLMARSVRAGGGEIEQLVGDCVMATFGRCGGGADHARRSLECACRMISAIDAWNRQRRRFSEPPVHIGLGVHYGPAAIGDIVDGKFRQTMVVGSAVNIASRLERLTRELDVTAVASSTVVSGAGAGLASRLGFVAHGAHVLRGCPEPTDVWVLPKLPTRAALRCARPRVGQPTLHAL